MLGQIVLDGASRAAQLVPLLFALNGPLPESAAAEPEPPFAAVAEEAAPLTLVEHNVAVRIEGGRARVRSLLTYRNDRAEPVSTGLSFPFPALVEQGERWRALGDEAADPDPGCGSDESPQAAQFVEAGEAVPPCVVVGYVTVAPGEEIRLLSQRTLALTWRDEDYRLALPLPDDRGAPLAPRFSADVEVVEQQAIRRLASRSHRVSVDGDGRTRVRLTVPGDRAYSAREFVVDIDFSAEGEATDYALWGGEARPR
jgi:hypothetical protein